jgi:hypothetical protein
MKKLIALIAIAALPALPVFALDIEKNFVPGFSVPASMVEVAKKNDKNFAATKSAVEALQAKTATVATGITVVYTTNVITYLNATTNAVSATNIIPRYTITTAP